MASDTMALLQQALNGGPEAQASLAEALATHEDPRIRMIAEWSARQQAAASQVIDVDAETGEDDGGETAAPAGHENPGDEIQRRLTMKLRRLSRELEFQREIGDTLAAALGACYLCWGDDPQCEECGGEGGPAWKQPDEAAYAQFIAPALERMQHYHEASQARPARARQPKSNTPKERKQP